ncbi:MAG TPA: response regulator transcription factor [Ignavibacteriaceae bacterium]|nr:response regulator transcription factor [Ignavibacteriaceae bacterium]
MKKKILLVDDEKDIVEFLKYNLELEDFDVITAFNGSQAIDSLKLNPDMVILDIMMPKMNGFEVCKAIRESKEYKNLPVIFLTAKSSEVDEVLGLELGANDFIQKPISPKKLIARVKSNFRKVTVNTTPESEQAPVIKIGPLVIDRERYIISINDNEKVFPRKEFELLYYLASNPGVVHSRESLLKNVWGSDVYVVDRTVDVHIRKIREKLDVYSHLIETLKGVGYRFKEDN